MSDLLPKKIKSLMIKQGMTIASLERKAGLNRGALWPIMNGKISNPKQSTLEKLSKALGCGVEELTGNNSYRRITKNKPWNYNLYVECIKQVDKEAKKNNLALDAGEILNMSEFLYVYSLENGKYDKLYTNLLVAKHLSNDNK